MIAQQGALHDDRKMQRRTKSAPALGADANRGRSPVTRLRSTAALNKEESLARSSRLIFDTVAERDKLDALGQQTSRAGDGAGTTGRKKKKKKDTGASPATNSLSSSFSSYASTAPDPAQSCGAWLRHWSEDGAVAWATEYFARRRWHLRDFFLPTWHGESGDVCLGEGGDGVVTFAVEATHKIPCVLKELYSEGDREIIIHATLEHRRIVRFYADFYDEDSDTRYIVLEFMSGGTLFDALPDEGGISDSEAAYIIRQLTEILKYLHTIGVVYADLKTSNVLLDAAGSLKLADFGASHWAAGSRKLRNITGTVDTQPPEMQGHVGFDKLVDNWSLGVLTYRLLVGDYPFSYNEDDESIRANILNLAYELPDWVSPDAASLIKGLLKLDPKQRLSLTEVIQHPWLKTQKGATIPSFLTQRATMEVDCYTSSLSFETLHPAQDATSVLSVMSEYLSAPVSPASFALCLAFTFALGMATAFNIQSALNLC